LFGGVPPLDVRVLIGRVVIEDFLRGEIEAITAVIHRVAIPPIEPRNTRDLPLEIINFVNEPDIRSLPWWKGVRGFYERADPKLRHIRESMKSSDYPFPLWQAKIGTDVETATV